MKCFVLSGLFLSLPLLAAPLAENVVVSQPAGSSLVRIDYSLSGEDAIVTMDVKTNGVSIGGANIQYLVGHVNSLVATNGSCWILWDIAKSWPGHEVTDSGVTVELRTWTKTMPPLYMSTWLACPSNASYYADASYVPGGVTNDIYKTEQMLFRFIPAKGETFRLGAAANEPGAGAEDSHFVSLTKNYWMAVYEMTQRQNQRLVGAMNGPSAGDAARATCPAERQSSEYLAGGKYDVYGGNYDNFNSAGPVRQIRESLGIREVSFPTEAQWEFACRSGSDSAYYGSGGESSAVHRTNKVDRIAWYDGNSGGVSHPVGGKAPNAFSLYDMLGNVEEVVWDQFEEWQGYDSKIDPFRAYPIRGADYWGWTVREYRGGSFDSAITGVRCAARHRAGNYAWPSTDAADVDQRKAGFRAAVTIVE